MVDHSPRPDNLKCEVKWALGDITMNYHKLVQMMEFQLSYFKSSTMV